MVRTQSWLLRATALSVSAMLLLAACGGSTTSPAPGVTSGPGATGGAASGGADAKKGGTIFILRKGVQWSKVDPQRIYTGEELAFFSATLQRSLLAYKLSPDATEGTSLTPDLATDLGTATDAGKTWSFTLRDGPKWQDGSPITCEDVKYGVSRTFSPLIKEGPTYQVQYLDIASVDGFRKKKDGTTGKTSRSAYGGPYDANLPIFSDEALTKPVPNDKAAYDKAVVCEGKKITFHLNKPVGDFNYTVTLGFSPVPKAKDTGETYGTVAPWVMSSGPYQVASYTTGPGGKMILDRNPNWDQASDPYRTAYPDHWEIDFGIASAIIDQRIIEASGNDVYALQYGSVQPQNLNTVFADASTPNPDFAGRAISGFDPYSSYYWIDVNKVPNVKIRQAMAVALDREAIRLNEGGAFAGTFADGYIKPNIGQDYAPSGFYDSFFGKKIPDTGDPELAKKLIQESGVPAPKLKFNFGDDDVAKKTAAIVISSLGLAGITVTPAPIETSNYYTVIFDPASAGDFGVNGWGADWPNASTVIPPLFTQVGGWDTSQVDDPAYNAEVDKALAELDRPAQALLWQALNKKAVENVYAIPTFFGLSQTIAGPKVGPIYRWSAYGSWPYAAMYVIK